MRDEDPRLGAMTPLVTRAHDVRTDAAGLEHMTAAMDRTHRGVVRQLIAAEARIAELEAEAARLRRANHQVAQRAFFLQPGLRVLVGGHPGVTQEAPVMVPVLLDGMHQAGRFPAEFVHLDTSIVAHLGDGTATVDGQRLEVRNIHLTRNAEETPLDGADVGRPPFHHQAGSASDYLEALAEEICHGPRTVESVETIAHGGTLKIHIRFDVPSKRAQLTDLLYVDEP